MKFMNHFLAGFETELLKVAFGGAEADKVLGIAKKLKLPKGSAKMFPSLGGLGGLPHRGRVVEDLVKNKKTLGNLENHLVSSGMSKEFARDYGKSIREQAEAEMKKTDRISKQVPGGAIVRDKQNVNKTLRSMTMPGSPIQLPEHTAPKDHKMVNAIMEGHEFDEAKVKSSPGVLQFGHRSPDVILREHNRVATLPKEHEGAREYMKGIRDQREGKVLQEHGIEYGKEGTRLSRHARRHLTEIMSRKEGG